MEAMIMQNLILNEYAKAIGEWMRTITREEDNETNMAKRSTNRNIFGQVGSAIGDESSAMLKTQDDKKEAATTAAVAAKNDQAKDKRARDVTTLVTNGSEILQRLDQLGPNEMLRLKIDELHALLLNADPQGSILKPNKKTGLEKANLLSIVQAAIGRFLR
jgi:hypothetical protein